MSVVFTRLLNLEYGEIRKEQKWSATLAFRIACCPISNQRKGTNLSKPLGCRVEEKLSWQLTLTSASLGPTTKQEPWKARRKGTSWHHRNRGRIHSVNGDWHSSQNYTTAHSSRACSGTYIIHSESCIQTVLTARNKQHTFHNSSVNVCR